MIIGVGRSAAIGVACLALAAWAYGEEAAEPALEFEEAAESNVPVEAGGSAGLDAIVEVRRPTEIEETITVNVGRSTLFRATQPLQRVAVADPEIADVEVVEPDQLILLGRSSGSTDLIIWGEAGRIWRAEVRVDMDTAVLNEQLAELFPEASLRMERAGEVYFLTGTLNHAGEASQIHEFLEASGLTYTDMTRVPGAQQVQIEVRVTEVNRRAIRRLGFSALGPFEEDFFLQFQPGSEAGPMVPVEIGVPSETPAAPGLPFELLEDVSSGPLVGLVAGFPGEDLQFFLQALAENQYVRMLAEPTLLALSGEEASFLAGGEIPIPVAQPGQSGSSITIEYREFGVRLQMRPEVLGDGKIRLQVAPEVSDLSAADGVMVEGFEIPALLTRRSETTLEMYSGQTFAMAGLLNQNMDARSSRLPVLGDMPVLGPLFRSQSFQSGESELMILVTATLVEPTSDGLRRELPGDDIERPSDWEFFVEGRIHGRPRDEAPRPDKPDFTELRGPGGWAEYGPGQ